MGIIALIRLSISLVSTRLARLGNVSINSTKHPTRLAIQFRLTNYR